MMRTLTAIAIAIAFACGPAWALPSVESGEAAAPSRPIVCVTPEIARGDFEAAIARAGNPPAVIAYGAVPAGFVMALWIAGNPQVMNLVFVDGCLARQFLTPAP